MCLTASDVLNEVQTYTWIPERHIFTGLMSWRCEVAIDLTTKTKLPETERSIHQNRHVGASPAQRRASVNDAGPALSQRSVFLFSVTPQGHPKPTLSDRLKCALMTQTTLSQDILNYHLFYTDPRDLCPLPVIVSGDL